MTAKEAFDKVLASVTTGMQPEDTRAGEEEKTVTANSR
jgi:hypothetical protein